MTSSISSTSATGHMRMHRPDPTQMASKLFSKLDTKNQGYIEKSDLQSAFDNISSSGGSTGVDDVFQQLDSDSDGKITKDEMSSGLQKLAEQLDSQFNDMRMNGFGGGQGMSGMPPPPQDGDGKVSLKEAMAYDKSNSSGSASSTSAAGNSDAAVMHKIMQLMQAYGGFGQDTSQSGLASLLSASA